jgi:hypothetical protein
VDKITAIENNVFKRWEEIMTPDEKTVEKLVEIITREVLLAMSRAGRTSKISPGRHLRD